MVRDAIEGMFPKRSVAPIVVSRPIEPPRASLVPDWVHWLLIGIGIAAGGVATAFAIAGAPGSASSDVVLAPADQVRDEEAHRRTYQHLAIASGVAGVAFVGTSIAFWLFD
jgi:hypothetical protein